jgi:hypothetical protein
MVPGVSPAWEKFFSLSVGFFRVGAPLFCTPNRRSYSLHIVTARPVIPAKAGIPKKTCKVGLPNVGCTGGKIPAYRPSSKKKFYYISGGFSRLGKAVFFSVFQLFPVGKPLFFTEKGFSYRRVREKKYPPIVHHPKKKNFDISGVSLAWKRGFYFDFTLCPSGGSPFFYPKKVVPFGEIQKGLCPLFGQVGETPFYHPKGIAPKGEKTEFSPPHCPEWGRMEKKYRYVIFK